MTGTGVRGSLHERLAARGPLLFGDVLDLGAHVAEALAECHDYGRPHRDVSVTSVRRAGAGPWFLGTPAAAAPVRPGSRRPAGPIVPAEAQMAEDIRALGVLVAAALTGRPADGSSPIGDEAADVPPGVSIGLWSDVRGLLAELLDDDAGRRPSADAAARRFRAARADWRAQRRRPWRGEGADDVLVSMRHAAGEPLEEAPALPWAIRTAASDDHQHTAQLRPGAEPPTIAFPIEDATMVVGAVPVVSLDDTAATELPAIPSVDIPAVDIPTGTVPAVSAGAEPAPVAVAVLPAKAAPVRNYGVARFVVAAAAATVLVVTAGVLALRPDADGNVVTRDAAVADTTRPAAGRRTDPTITTPADGASVPDATPTPPRPASKVDGERPPLTTTTSPSDPPLPDVPAEAPTDRTPSPTDEPPSSMPSSTASTRRPGITPTSVPDSAPTSTTSTSSTTMSTAGTSTTVPTTTKADSS